MENKKTLSTNQTALIRSLGIGGLIYLLYSMAKMLIQGIVPESEAPILLGTCVILSLGTLILIIFSFLDWKKQSNKEKEISHTREENEKIELN